jgi:hypothetical protein
MFFYLNKLFSIRSNGVTTVTMMNVNRTSADTIIGALQCEFHHSGLRSHAKAKGIKLDDACEIATYGIFCDNQAVTASNDGMSQSPPDMINMIVGNWPVKVDVYSK